MHQTRYDVIHNHAFDAPAIRLATALQAPVVHTLHLPPDKAVSAALRQVAQRGGPPAGAPLSEFPANARRPVISLPPPPPPHPPPPVPPPAPAPRPGAPF